MTAVAQPAALPREVALSPVRVVRAEWLKLLTLRSNWVMLVLTVLIIAGLGPLISLANAHQGMNGSTDPGQLVQISQIGVSLAQVLVGVFGVLVTTNEYASGMIRASFTAVPTRLAVMAAKLLVLVVVVLVLAVISGFIGFFASVPIDAHSAYIPAAPSLHTPDAVRSILLGAVYLGLIAIFGNGLGWLLRNTAGAIASLLGLLLLAPIVLAIAPVQVLNDIEHWLPVEAYASMTAAAGAPGIHTPLVGTLVMLGYVAATVLGASVVLTRRDA